MADGEEMMVPGRIDELVSGEMDISRALPVVLKKALIHDGLYRGIRQVVKLIEKGEARLVILADDCSEPPYQRLIEALCHEANVDILRVPERVALGEWCGLNRLRKNGEVQKAIGTSVAAIRGFGENTDELSFVLNYVKKNQK